MKKKEEGITLIALVITIIALLILAGITIGSISGDDSIIEQTRKTAQNAQRESIIEKLEADLYSEKVKTGEVPSKQKLKEIISKNYGTIDKDGENELNSFTSNKGGYQINFLEIEGWKIDISEYVKIGDFVDYEPESEESRYEFFAEYTGYTDNQIVNKKEFKWRVLDITNNEVLLISDLWTDEKVSLSGALGYNNGVYLLNDYCKTLYSNEKINAVSRSLNIEDVQEKMDVNKWDYHDYEVSNGRGLFYGESSIYNTGKYYPYMWSLEKSENNNAKIDGKVINGRLGKSEQETLVTQTYSAANNSIEVEARDWYKPMSTMETLFMEADARNEANKTNIYYDLFYSPNKTMHGDSFLSTRCTDIPWTDQCKFSLKIIGAAGINSGALFYNSSTNSCTMTYYIRPVVSLPGLTIDLNTDYETEGTWKILYN